MNKKITYILIVLFAVFVVRNVLGQTTAPSTTIAKSTPTPTTEKGIEVLKEKIASKVEELRKGNRKVVTGTITTIKGDSLEMQSSDKKTITVTIDDTLTKIYKIESGKKKEIEKESLKNKDYIVVAGPTVENTVTANTIYVDFPVTVGVGHITNIDKDTFTIDIVTTEKEESTLDIETTTKQQIMDTKTLEIKTVGFSKLKIGDTIHFSTQSTKPDTVSLLRLLVIPQEFFLKATPTIVP